MARVWERQELEDALLTLGMAKSRVEVQRLMDLVDEDKSGQIEFGEFLAILKGPSQIYGSKLDEHSKINQSIMKFFKDMVGGKLGVHEQGSSVCAACGWRTDSVLGDDTKKLPFKLILSQIRRKNLLALMHEYKLGDAYCDPKDEITMPYQKIITRILALAKEKEESGQQDASRDGASRPELSYFLAFRVWGFWVAVVWGLVNNYRAGFGV